MQDNPNYRRLFQKYDTNGDGSLSTEEFCRVIQELQMDASEPQVQGFLTLVDDNFDGRMQFDEFCHFMHVVENADLNNNAEMLFFAADKDFSGTIDTKELHTLLMKLGYEISPEQTDKLVKNVCDNTDGTLSFEVFKTLIDNIV